MIFSLCLMMTQMVHSQSWKANADALIVNQIFANVVGTGDIYAFPNLLTSTDTIFLADGTFVRLGHFAGHGRSTSVGRHG